MNRQIKFRGLRVDGKGWVYGSLQLPYKPFDEYYIWDTHINKIKVKPDSVGQFTGISDKNGVEIYEGDTLNSRDELMIIDGSDEYLHYDFYSFIYTVMYSESHSGLNGETRKDIEVIDKK